MILACEVRKPHTGYGRVIHSPLPVLDSLETIQSMLYVLYVAYKSHVKPTL